MFWVLFIGLLFTALALLIGLGGLAMRIEYLEKTLEEYHGAELVEQHRRIHLLEQYARGIGMSIPGASWLDGTREARLASDWIVAEHVRQIHRALIERGMTIKPEHISIYLRVIQDRLDKRKKCDQPD